MQKRRLKSYISILAVLPVAGIAVTHMVFPALSQPTPAVRVIEDFRDETKRILSQRIPVLRQEFETTSDLRRKLISALALGTHLDQRGDFRAALQYLQIAKTIAKTEDPLQPNINYNLGQVYFHMKAYDASLKYLQLH